jgi:hypothetical protein
VGIVNLGYAAFVIFAHLAHCATAIRRLPAAEIVRFGFGVSLSSFCFAQRAFCAKLIGKKQFRYNG